MDEHCEEKKDESDENDGEGIKQPDDDSAEPLAKTEEGNSNEQDISNDDSKNCNEKKDESAKNDGGGVKQPAGDPKKSASSEPLPKTEEGSLNEQDISNDDTKSTHNNTTESSEDEKPPFKLPHRFHNPGNALILCDGPVHAGKRHNDNSDNSEEYQCERAYHQQCHFIPVLSIPRGPWRCLICRYRDEEYLKEKAARKKTVGGGGGRRKEQVGKVENNGMEDGRYHVG